VHVEIAPPGDQAVLNGFGFIEHEFLSTRKVFNTKDTKAHKGHQGTQRIHKGFLVFLRASL
jgi:hypothetical protein